MAALAQLGDETFFTLGEIAEGKQQRLEIEARSGVDGQALWKTGRRGEVFQVESIADFADLGQAHSALRRYELLVGGDPTTMIYAGLTESFDVVILGVKPLPHYPKRILLGVGGLITPAYAVLRCTWQLLAVPPA